MENIYQQAIADAKALRASAMANAKSALQEAFEPQIKEMVRLKLSEELDKDQLEEMEEEMYSDHEIKEANDETLDDAGLNEILAELDALSEEDSEEPKELEETYDETVTEDEEEEMEAEDDMEGEEDEDETQEITVSLGDLKDLIDKIKGLNPELASDEMADDEEEMDSEEEESEDDEELSLDEILAELEEDSLEEKKEMKPVKDMESKKSTNELEKAKETIAELSNSLNEVNLLNAKLLYMNKIFKAKSLTESQKIQVVKAFDKAASVKEVKNTFEILKESINAKKKSQIHESFGYASKPAGVSPHSNVIESDPFVNRWQKLAGL